MKFISFIFTILVFSGLSLNAESLTIYTEELPPLNFTRDSKITGLSTEVIEQVMKKTGFKYKIISIPWARAYKISQEEPNSFIYSISRRKKREQSFHWIGVIAPSSHSFFALKNRMDIKINKLEDLKKYQIGTVIEDARETYLVSKGFELDKFQRVAGKSAHLQNYKKLKKQRIDIWPVSNAVMNYLVKKIGDDPEKILRPVFVFPKESSGGFYLAASLSTKQDVINKVKIALENFKKTSEYTNILKKWGL